MGQSDLSCLQGKSISPDIVKKRPCMETCRVVKLYRKKTVDFSPGSRCVNGLFFGIPFSDFPTEKM